MVTVSPDASPQGHPAPADRRPPRRRPRARLRDQRAVGHRARHLHPLRVRPRGVRRCRRDRRGANARASRARHGRDRAGRRGHRARRAPRGLRARDGRAARGAPPQRAVVEGAPLPRGAVRARRREQTPPRDRAPRRRDRRLPGVPPAGGVRADQAERQGRDQRAARHRRARRAVAVAVRGADRSVPERGVVGTPPSTTRWGGRSRTRAGSRGGEPTTLWLRIDDVAATLAARTYPADGKLVFDSHGATWELVVSGGRATCKPSLGTPSLRFEATALASVVPWAPRLRAGSPASSWSTDPRMPLAIADRMFASAIAPWCPEVF
jgi:hypothetical protein